MFLIKVYSFSVISTFFGENVCLIQIINFVELTNSVYIIWKLKDKTLKFTKLAYAFVLLRSSNLG